MTAPVVRLQDSCPRCGVRGDVDCAHRPGMGPPPATLTERVDRRTVGGGGQYRFTGRGHNFRAANPNRSPKVRV